MHSNADIIRWSNDKFKAGRAFSIKYENDKVLSFDKTILNIPSNLTRHEIIVCDDKYSYGSGRKEVNNFNGNSETIS